MKTEKEEMGKERGKGMIIEDDDKRDKNYRGGGMRGRKRINRDRIKGNKDKKKEREEDDDGVEGRI